jgi:hypothetical protein
MLKIAFQVLFFAAMVIAPVAWFRILTAKTTRAYLQNIALFVLPILSVFGLAHLAGLMDLSALPQNGVPANPTPPNLSWIQIFLLAAAGGLWIIGGNVLLYWTAKRAGRSFWSNLNPFKPPFRDFTGRDWGCLAVLFLGAILLSVVALSLTPK